MSTRYVSRSFVRWVSIASLAAIGCMVSACGDADVAGGPDAAGEDDAGSVAPDATADPTGTPTATPTGSATSGADSGPPVGPPTPLGPPVQGEGTYYAADGSGNCSFDPSPQDLMVAALNLTDYAGSAACGSCIAIDGPRGSVTVRVVDSCPGCAKGDVDLSQQAFAKIAALSAGRVKITWKTVPCGVTGNVAYRFKEGSSKFYTAIQVRNHRVPIAKLEYKKAGVYVNIPRKTYNYFVVDTGVGDQPSGLAVRVTASNGAVLEDLLPGTIVAGSTVPGKAQFP
jgi:expansin (peptidoglycan-binding protein)